MKNSIKTAALLVAIMGASFAVKAQTTSGTTPASNSGSNGVIISVGAESGISVGDFRDAHKWSIGGTVQADIPVVNQLYANINTGYLNYFGKDNVFGTGLRATDIHTLPVMAGLKLFPVKYFYIQADAGAAFALNKSDLGYDKTAAFLYVPQVGVQLPVGGKNYIDAGVLYNGSTKFSSTDETSKINSIALRVAYAFGTK